MALEIFKLVGSVMVDNSKANESLQKTDEKAGGLASKLAKGIGTAAKWGAGIATAAAAGATALAGMSVKAAGTTDNIDKMSQKIGVSRQAYQELDFICSQSGMSVDKLQGGMKSLTAAMDGAKSGTESNIQQFKRLGVEVTNTDGTFRSQEDVMWDTLNALQNMENQTEKARLATELFGKSGTELMPLLNGQSGSIEEMKQKAHDLGLVLNDDAIDAGVKFTDTMDQAKRSLTSIVTKIGVGVMPIFQNFLDFIISNMPTIQVIFTAVFGVVENIVTSVGNVISEILNLISSKMQESGITIEGIINGLRAVMQGVFVFLQGLWTSVGQPIFDLITSAIGVVASYFASRMPEISAFVSKAFKDIQAFWTNNLQPCLSAIANFLNNTLSPIFKFVFNNVIAPAVDSAFRTIKNLWDSFLKPVLTGITTFLTGVFTGNFKQAFSGIVSAVKGVFGGIVSVVKAPLNSVIGIVNKFIGGLNKLKIPDWVPEVGGKGINISKIPLLAKGGNVIEGGKAIVGEAGAELIDLPAGARVTPLSGRGTTIGDEESIKLLEEILSELKDMKSDLYYIIVEALINGVRIDWNERELMRLVKKYA